MLPWKPFRYPVFLTIKNHEQSALQKDLAVIALFVEQLKTYFEKV